MGSYIERIVWFTRLMCYKPADLVDMYYILIQQTDSHFPQIFFKNDGRIKTGEYICNKGSSLMWQSIFPHTKTTHADTSRLSSMA